MIPILDRYITKEVLGPFIFGIAAFTCILSGSTVLFYLIGDAIRYGIPIMQVVQLFIYKLPSVMVFTFPMSILLATILSFGRLSSDLELLALRAGGVSFFRMIIPVVFIGFSVSLLTIWFNEKIVPQSTHSWQNMMSHYSTSNAPKIKQNVNLTEYDPEGFPLRIINIRSVDNGELKSITMAEYDKGTLTRVINANSGRWIPSGGWEFYNGVMHQFSAKNPYAVSVIDFKKEYIDIPISPQQSMMVPKQVDEMTLAELKDRIETQQKTGEDPIQNIMRYHMRFSIAFASLIFSILGAVVGVRPHRSTSAVGLGISLLIIFAYYVLLSVGMGLGVAHLLPPLLGAWLPNIIVGSAAFYLLGRTAK